MADIAVIDYGMGNLRSVSKALEHVAPQLDIVVSSDPDVIAKAGRVVFPGVGAMPDCMRELDARGLRQAVLEAAQSKPFLGICLGMQALFESSAKKVMSPVWAFCPARCCVFRRSHGGRQGAEAQGAAHRLERGASGCGTPDVGGHSRRVRASISCTAITSRRASRIWWPVSPFIRLRLPAAVARDNIFAVQFHPEKSQAAGLTLLANFVMWDGQAHEQCL